MSELDEKMGESKRSGRLMALRSKFEDLTLALKTKTLPKGKKISDGTNLLESLYSKFVFKANVLVAINVDHHVLRISFRCMCKHLRHPINSLGPYLEAAARL